MAINSKEWDVAKYLAQAGADANAKNKLGYTPLYRAVKSEMVDLVKYLQIQKVPDINAKDIDGATLLQLAAFGGRLDIVKYFTEKGADVLIKDNLGRAPLHGAAYRGGLDVVEYLVEKGADLHVKDNEDITPLHIAAFNGKMEVVEYLVKKGADVNAKDKGGKTPIDFAAIGGKLEIVKYLKRKSADLNASKREGDSLKPQPAKEHKRKRRENDQIFFHAQENATFTVKNNQATNETSKLSSWMNSMIDPANKGIAKLGNLLFSSPKTPSSLTSPTVDRGSTPSGLEPRMDVGSTMLLLDLFVRKITGEKYPFLKESAPSELEARSFAINIVEEFKEVLRTTCNRPVEECIDLTQVQSNLFKAVISGKADKIPEILQSYVHSATLKPKVTEKLSNLF